ncbi:hypothetical protein B0T10DRAFT_456863 [Thelonectria olida]|uniref:Uncharacterized protein n=1 Tax=Thelonectria olida TaxID=1576542 RepID=A0A9P8W9F0_9HYPO|nr:hypothetical protein B0T10DRAFT_456863 [Thelonectria olida]
MRERNPQSYTGFKELSRHPRQPSDIRNSQRQNERLEPDEEMFARIKELNAITKPAVIEILKNMQECSKITQAQSENLIEHLKTMPLDLFEDSVRAFLGEMSSRKMVREGRTSQNFYIGSIEGPTAFNYAIGSGKNYKHKEEKEEESGHSTETHDHESVAPASDSEDWEDCTDDEEHVIEDEDDSHQRSRSPSTKSKIFTPSRRAGHRVTTH